MFYTPLPDGRIQCNLCPWQCEVDKGKLGRCRVRENREGKYHTLVHGRAVAAHPDPIEKKPFFHVLPGTRAYSIATIGCNFDCKFCQNHDISQASPDRVNPPEMPPDQIVANAIKAKCETVAYTYSEPVIFYEYMHDCALAARDKGLGNIMVSNGFINEKPLRKILPLLTAIKIDLKAFSPGFYSNTCSGRLQPVMDTLERIAGSGVWLEIVVLLIPTLNDNLDEIQRMADWIVKKIGPDVPLHFTRFRPMYRIQNLPPTPLRTLELARQTAMNQGCRYVYGGNIPGMAGEDTHCPQCKNLIIDRSGFALLANGLSDGKCAKCGRDIPGIWKWNGKKQPPSEGEPATASRAP